MVRRTGEKPVRPINPMNMFVILLALLVAHLSVQYSRRNFEERNEYSR